MLEVCWLVRMNPRLRRRWPLTLSSPLPPAAACGARTLSGTLSTASSDAASLAVEVDLSDLGLLACGLMPDELDELAELEQRHTRQAQGRRKAPAPDGTPGTPPGGKQSKKQRAAVRPQLVAAPLA